MAMLQSSSFIHSFISSKSQQSHVCVNKEVCGDRQGWVRIKYQAQWNVVGLQRLGATLQLWKLKWNILRHLKAGLFLEVDRNDLYAVTEFMVGSCDPDAPVLWVIGWWFSVH